MRIILILLMLSFQGHAQVLLGRNDASSISGRPISTAIPSNGNVLSYNSTTGKWEPAAASAGTGDIESVTAGVGLLGGGLTGPVTVTASADAGDVLNCSIGVTFPGSSAIAFSLLDANGGALSATSPCVIAFRSATLATGTTTQVSTTAASAGVNTVTLATGDSGGCATASTPCVWAIYAVNNAGTVNLAFYVGADLDESQLQSTTALTGGADTANHTLWATSALSTLSIRLLAKGQATPGAVFAWTTNTQIENNAKNSFKRGWFINAYISGAAPDLTTSARSPGTEITDAALTLTPITGSAPVGIMCSSTNAATAPSTGATICAAGSESIGINFTLPSPGIYRICFASTYFGRVGQGVRIFGDFRMVETATNAQTALGPVTLVSGAQVMGGATAGASNEYGYQVYQCNNFDWTGVAAGTVKGIREFYGQTLTGVPTQVALYCTGAADSYNCFWTVDQIK